MGKLRPWSLSLARKCRKQTASRLLLVAKQENIKAGYKKENGAARDHTSVAPHSEVLGMGRGRV